ncbi:MAG: circularly permuted type 2 ATP-grasp protein [Actinomycetota bacterium]
MRALDELTSGGVPREGIQPLWEAIADIGPTGLIERASQRDAYLSMQGITFTLSGLERPLPVDLIPRVITSSEWEIIEAGIKQRILALEAFLADVYGPQKLFADDIVPRSLVESCQYYYRHAHGINPANGVRIHVSGIDLIRDEQGILRVLEDNLRCPSGVSYVLENRRTMAHVAPELFGEYSIRSVDEYPEHLLNALTAATPEGVTNPNIIVLTPGVHNSAHFEHAFLARRMGVELVEGRDLFCRNNALYMRTTQGSTQVHVVYRRIDDDYLDPVHFRPDSILGVPGLLNAARAGKVTIANGVGNGVADDKALYPFVPKLIEYYLGEKAILPNVETYDLQDPDLLRYVIENIASMVVKPVAGSGGYGITIGPMATEAELEIVVDEITANPRGWIAQPMVALSTCPTVREDGTLAPRHVDLRPFAVNDGKKIWVLPGGLTRVALIEGNVVVNSSQGGGSKDTWVLAPEKSATETPIEVFAEAEVSEEQYHERLTPPQQGPDVLPMTRLQQQEEQQQQFQQNFVAPPPLDRK